MFDNRVTVTPVNYTNPYFEFLNKFFSNWWFSIMWQKNTLKMTRTGLPIMVALGTCLIFDYLTIISCTCFILHSIICQWCFAQQKADSKWKTWWNEVLDMKNVRAKIRLLKPQPPEIILIMRLDVIWKFATIWLT